MKILPVKEYNAKQLIKYQEDCKNYQYGQGGFPQVAFYLFFKPNGSYRQTGFVAFNDNRAYLRSTKKEAIEIFNK